MTAPGQPNFQNQTMWTRDNLDVLRGMNSECVDLIYLDPPFNSNANYAAPIGSKAAGAEFKDTWGLDDINLAWHGEIKHEQPGLYALLDATRQVHGDSMMSYLIYMAIRVMEMRRVLKPTGSIYLHCDPTASHYLKLLMDAVFGKRHFLNEVVWHYKSFHGNVKRYFPKKHDTLLVYKKSNRWTFNRLFRDDNTDTIDYARWRDFLVDGRNILGKKMPVQDSRFRRFLRRWVRENGRQPGPDDIVYEVTGQAFDTVWNIKPIDPKDKTERVGYPTQKPLALLGRIIGASSDPGDMVLDPFCGCATACIAAEQLGREWAGIDVSAKAVDLVRDRMHREVGIFYKGAERTDVPLRTDLGKIIPYNALANKKWLYGEQGGYCNGCAEHFQMQHFAVDHIIPRAKGGTDHISNLQLLCTACNSLKGTKSHAELLVLLTDKGWIKRRKAA